MSDALDRLRRFCEQVAADGILPSQAWFSETATELAALAAARLALQQENEQLKAQLRGMRDFLSGQPRVLPYGGGETASKESTLNLAWAIGYDGAEDSDAWKLLVSRADRTATRAAAAEAAGTLLRQELEILNRANNAAVYNQDKAREERDRAERRDEQLRQDLQALPRYSMVAHGAYGKKTDWVESCLDVKGEWIRARDLADRLARLAPQPRENKEKEKSE